MTDPERERIRAEATAAADDANWKKSVNDRIATIEKMHGYGVKAIIGAAVYLATQLWNFISSGGVIK